MEYTVQGSLSLCLISETVKDSKKVFFGPGDVWNLSITITGTCSCQFINSQQKLSSNNHYYNKQEFNQPRNNPRQLQGECKNDRNFELKKK